MLDLFPQVQSWAGEAEAARLSLQSWSERVYQLHAASKTYNLELRPTYLTL